MKKHVSQPSDFIETRLDTLVSKARRLRLKGDVRKAIVALREACLLDEECASLWTLYGALLAGEGRLDDAQRALRHAVWLRRTSHDTPRERSTERYLRSLAQPAAALATSVSASRRARGAGREPGANASCQRRPLAENERRTLRPHWLQSQPMSNRSFWAPML